GFSTAQPHAGRSSRDFMQRILDEFEVEQGTDHDRHKIDKQRELSATYPQQAGDLGKEQAVKNDQQGNVQQVQRIGGITQLAEKRLNRLPDEGSNAASATRPREALPNSITRSG
ncbi:hypothetical protein L7Q18_32890, partial [Achromobacter xylosoxidans]|uniref:hypothetical protein n=1 Tax=Alcaligenes xylosoxydans xylosoxydans TaxID=85698 RepID=UPI001F05AC7E